MAWTRGRRIAAVITLAILAVFANNTNAFRAPSGRRPTILAHRGLAQEYDRTDLQGDTCTAARMLPPRHPYLENTIAGIDAAFRAGADMVEIDVHPTTDGEFAVFHDWTLDCRTDGHGVTREHTLAELQALDVGYGYTADGGHTHPFRGKGARMPSLREVLAAFPDRRFLINVKSGEASEGELLAAYLPDPEHLAFSGADAPMAVLAERTGRPTLSKGRLKACLLPYLAAGWTGYVPGACRHSIVYVPVNVGPIFWGWPGVFVDRMAAADVDVYVIGPWTGGWSDGVDDPADLARIPGWDGGISTDQVDVIAPLVID
jgi:glycerophosphoryl diester phosphodiesterase